MSHSSQSPLLFVLPVRIGRVLKVPQRAAALNDWEPGKVIGRRRRIRGPLKCPGVPRIAAGRLTAEIGPGQVSQEDQNPSSLEENSDGHDQVPRVPTTARLIGIDSSRHAQQSWDMHEVECQVEADDENPEVQLAERLVVHLSRHLREPVVKGSEETEDNTANNHVVKMRDYEIRVPQVPVEGGGTLHDPCETSDQELEKKSNTEQHR